MTNQLSPVHIYLGCSLDGFIAGPENALDWLQADYAAENDLRASGEYLDYPEFFKGIGCLLMGRTTYDVVSEFDQWPYGELPVLVASHRPIPSAPKSVKHIQGNITSLIAAAKEKANGKGVYLDGGSLARQGLNAGLVDHMTLTYLPILLGKGTRLFDILDHSRLMQFISFAASGKGLVQVSCKTKAEKALHLSLFPAIATPQEVRQRLNLQ